MRKLTELDKINVERIKKMIENEIPKIRYDFSHSGNTEWKRMQDPAEIDMNLRTVKEDPI